MVELLGAILIAAVLIASLLTAYAAWYGAPFVPAPQAAVEAALTLAEVGPKDTLLDWGAGDGRVIVAAARRGARAVGYELSPFVWVLAWVRLRVTRSRARLRLADASRADLSDVSVVFLFLVPRTHAVVARHLRSRLRPGARVITYAFPLPGWDVRAEVKPPGCGTVRLYAAPG
jgi:hypothetical protein